FSPIFSKNKSKNLPIFVAPRQAADPQSGKGAKAPLRQTQSVKNASGLLWRPDPRRHRRLDLRHRWRAGAALNARELGLVELLGHRRRASAAARAVMRRHLFVLLRWRRLC